jgi:thiosulfate/3-mercaptopyruvate sulfurtransferase
MLLPLTCALLLTAAADEKRPAYPRAELLIEVSELMRPEATRRFHLLDTRGKEKYEAGHIPGAVAVNTLSWSKAFAASPDAETWGKHLAAVGIRNTEMPVVVYGDDPREAARVWWILHYWGLKDVRLLNGGWQAWEAAKGPVSKETVTPAAGPGIKLTPVTERNATKSFLLEAVKGKTHQILDVRSTQEYCGETESAKRNGAIPGAVHLEWSEVLDPKSKRFKPPEELTRLFQDAGIDPSRPTATYCQSGGRAAVMAFTLELMGGKEVRNYYRSWAEWGNADDTPIVKPKK